MKKKQALDGKFDQRQVARHKATGTARSTTRTGEAEIGRAAHAEQSVAASSNERGVKGMQNGTGGRLGSRPAVSPLGSKTQQTSHRATRQQRRGSDEQRERNAI